MPHPRAAPTPAAELTVGQYLDEWLELQATQLQPSTWDSYRATIRRYVEPTLGEVPVAEVQVRDVTALYARLFARGGAGGRPLAMRSVEYVHAILHKAFSDAVDAGIVVGNPTRRALLPKVDHVDAGDPARELRVWSAAQLRAFLDHARAHRLRELWIVAAFTGMRRGELLGLRWEDVDLDAGLLRVRRSLSVIRGHARLKEPKTGRPRALHLDAFTVDALRAQRQRQAAWKRERGPCWDNAWDLVFTTDSGVHLSPDGVSHEFRRALRDAPVPRIRLHDLRHLHATLMLQAGVPVKVVSERLGHASTQITLDTYAHVLPAMDADAAVRFAAHVLGAAWPGPPGGPPDGSDTAGVTSSSVAGRDVRRVGAKERETPSET